MKTVFHFPCLLSALLILVIAGCSGDTADESSHDHEGAHEHGHDHEHEHDDRPESYTAAMTELKHHIETIRSASEAGKLADADESIHEVGHILKDLPEVAAETDMPKADWDEVNNASKELFDMFAKIDKHVHGGDGPSYADLADQIDEGISVLSGKISAAGEPAETAAGHDHEHDEDHDHGADSSPTQE